MECNRKTIWGYAQNKPSLIVKDIKEKYPEIPSDFIYKILLSRGIFKWLAVRRDLIKYKNTLRDKISALNRKKTPYEKGYHAALIECRKEIRKYCHSDRWRAPDFDKKANLFLKGIE